MARRARLKRCDNSHSVCMSPTAQWRLLSRKKNKKGLGGLATRGRLLATWKGRIVRELDKVLGVGVTSMIGGACSCRSGTPKDTKGPWEPNMETLGNARACLPKAKHLLR